MEYLKEITDFDFKKNEVFITISKGARGKLLEVPAHWHDLFEIVVCRSDGKLFAEGKEYRYGKGDIVIMPSRFLHGYKETEKGTYTVFFLSEENIISVKNSQCDQIIKDIFFGKVFYPFVIEADTKSCKIMHDILEKLENAEKNGNLLGQKSLVLEFFSQIPCDKEINRKQTYETFTIRRIIDFLERNFADTITLELLSKKAAMSKFYFIKVFKKYCGTTPVEYLLNLRLNRAYDMITSGKTVTEAAFSSGFNNLSYFTRQFKKKFFSLPKDIKTSSDFIKS